jgi:hypothetical protein
MPLTGEPIDDPSQIPDRPAMAVKIENSEAARPQTGLNEADIVFEEIINDGYTRFAAVFQSQGVDAVGPIRSGRHPDIDLLESLDHPLFVWSGGSSGVTTTSTLRVGRSEASGYYRCGAPIPFDLYTSPRRWGERRPTPCHPADLAVPASGTDRWRSGRHRSTHHGRHRRAQITPRHWALLPLTRG